jgi:heat-inducible transcriptional repressor
MGNLEKAGFLYQPYTSAGRIPSDSGYRIYVDRLLDLDHNSHKFPVEKFLDATWQYFTGSYEVIFQNIANTLADLTGCIALITLPQTTSSVLHHLQLVKLPNEQIMLVMVIDNYQTESFILDGYQLTSSEEEYSSEMIDRELEILSNFLNHKLKGKSLKEISSLNWQELDNEFKNYANFINNLLTKIKSKHIAFYSKPILLQGFSKLIQQPEFSQIEQIKILLNFLEKEQEQLFSLVFDLNNDFNKVQIRIGTENPLESMQSCSLISAYYSQDDYPVGSVGIIGPTRLPYEQAIALVESTADYLSEKL